MALEAPQFPALDKLRAKKTVLHSVLSLLGAEADADAAQDIAPALRALLRQVPYAVAPLVGELLLKPVDSIGAARVDQRLRAILPSDLRQENVKVQATQIAGQLHLTQAIVQDSQIALAGLGAWRRHSEAALVS